jgi:hypothetical protein
MTLVVNAISEEIRRDEIMRDAGYRLLKYHGSGLLRQTAQHLAYLNIKKGCITFESVGIVASILARISTSLRSERILSREWRGGGSIIG